MEAVILVNILATMLLLGILAGMGIQVLDMEDLVIIQGTMEDMV